MNKLGFSEMTKDTYRNHRAAFQSHCFHSSPHHRLLQIAMFSALFLVLQFEPSTEFHGLLQETNNYGSYP